MMRLVFVLLSLFALSACGGGGGGFTQSAPNVTRIASLSNGGKLYTADRLGFSYVIFSTSAETPELDAVVNLDLNNFTTLSSGSNWEILEGNYIYNGEDQYLYAYVEVLDAISGDGVLSGLSYNYVDDKIQHQSYGTQLSGNLPAGNVTYTGYNSVSNIDATFTDAGSFTMNANFSTGKGSISANGDDTYMQANGFGINTRTGSFSATNATVGYIGGASSSDRLDGHFNGKNAKGVSGIYTDTGNLGLVGSIAGSR